MLPATGMAFLILLYCFNANSQGVGLSFFSSLLYPFFVLFPYGRHLLLAHLLPYFLQNTLVLYIYAPVRVGQHSRDIQERTKSEATTSVGISSKHQKHSPCSFSCSTPSCPTYFPVNSDKSEPCPKFKKR